MDIVTFLEYTNQLKDGFYYCKSSDKVTFSYSLKVSQYPRNTVMSSIVQKRLKENRSCHPRRMLRRLSVVAGGWLVGWVLPYPDIFVLKHESNIFRSVI